MEEITFDLVKYLLTKILLIFFFSIAFYCFEVLCEFQMLTTFAGVHGTGFNSRNFQSRLGKTRCRCAIFELAFLLFPVKFKKFLSIFITCACVRGQSGRRISSQKMKQRLDFRKCLSLFSLFLLFIWKCLCWIRCLRVFYATFFSGWTKYDEEKQANYWWIYCCIDYAYWGLLEH